MGNGVYWGAFALGWFKHLHSSNLNSTDYRVLFLLCEKMKFDDNTAYLKQKEISEALNMDKGNVSKSIKKLREEQFIFKNKNGFMINPHLFYVAKGRSIDREILRDEFDDLIREAGLDRKFNLNEDEHKLEEHPDKWEKSLSESAHNHIPF
ncbi:winged helix-turn-helix transcriptional regulator [Planomicrobium sp. CPCC 101110]|nr:winged helix-turn-helix transcriptional regulator [Planomicrobium sp. CPCC 101110]